MAVENKTIDDKAVGLRLDRWLRELYPGMPFSMIQKALRTGQVRVDGKRVKGKERLELGQEVRIPPQFADKTKRPDIKKKHELTDEEVEFIRSLVIYRDDNIVAINKPAGIATQGGTKTTHHIDRLLSGLKELPGDERPRLVHRLDRDTSGVLILALNRDTATSLGRAFKGRTIQKTYRAITLGAPDPREGTIKAPLLKKLIGGQDKVVVDEEGQSAITDYMTLDFAARELAYVELYPHTGRQHQLRAHMAYLKCPVLGDNKYGGDESNLGKKQMFLHAYKIMLDDPEDASRAIEITADMPPHFTDMLNQTGLYEPEDIDA